MSKLKVSGITILCLSLIAVLIILPGCKEPKVIVETVVETVTETVVETVEVGAEEEGPSEEYAITVWKFGGTRIERSYGATKTAAWNEAHPDMMAEWVENDWSARTELVVTSLEAGNLPDVIIVDTQSIPDFASMGAIQAFSDLDPALVAEWETKFVPETFDLGMYEDKFYGFSTYVDIATFLGYNTEIIRKAGYENAEGDAVGPETWDELIDYCETLQAEGFGAIALSLTGIATDMNMIEGIAYANGGRWLDEDGNVAVNGPGFVDAVQLCADLAPYALAGSVESNYRDNATLFFNGQAALYPSLSWMGVWNTELQIPSDFAYNLTTFPVNPNPTGNFEAVSGIMTGTFCPMITTNAKDVEAALAYVDFWTQDEQVLGWNGSVQFGRVPTAIVAWSSADIEKFWPDLKAKYDAGTLFTEVLPMPAFPGLNESYEHFGTAVQEVVLGVSDAQTAMDKFADKVKEILGQ
jgi:multiple sugar transport system substrate-binding protein